MYKSDQGLISLLLNKFKRVLSDKKVWCYGLFGYIFFVCVVYKILVYFIVKGILVLLI